MLGQEVIKLLSFLLFFFLASPAWAVITMLDVPETANPINCGGAGTCDLTLMTLSAGTNRKALCAVTAEDTAITYDLNGMTFGGVAMVRAAQAESPTDNNIAELFYLDNASLPAAGNHTVAVDFTEDVGAVSITCWTVQDIAQGAPKETNTGASNTGTTRALSLPTVVATDWVFTVATESIGSTTNWTHGAGQVELSDVDFVQGTSSTTRCDGCTAPSSTWLNSARNAMVGAAWAAAGAAAGTVIKMGTGSEL